MNTQEESGFRYWVNRLKEASSDEQRLEAAQELFRAAIRTRAAVRTRGAAVTASTVLSAEEVEEILAKLAGSGDEVRRAAVQALAEWADANAVPAFVGLLNNDPDEGVRRLAAAALAGIHTPQAAGALCSAAEHDRSEAVRYDALSALASLLMSSETQQRASESERGAIRTRGVFLGSHGVPTFPELSGLRGSLQGVRDALHRITNAENEKPYIRGMAEGLVNAL